MNTQHLTNEEFTELLGGECASHEAVAHVEACGLCRDELVSMRSAVGDLRELSLRWAEEHARRITVPTWWALGRHRLPAFSAAASVLLCGLAIGIHYQVSVRGPDAGQAQTITAAPSEDELAQDNRLLQSIDHELSQQVMPQVPASELSISSRAARHRGPGEEAN
jgi:hypothetical protein